MTSIRNKILYGKIKKFVISSVCELDSIASKETLLMLDNFFSDNEIKVDYSYFIFKHFKELKKLPDFLDCAKYILKKPITR